jgi:hypothetical protein
LDSDKQKSFSNIVAKCKNIPMIEEEDIIDNQLEVIKRKLLAGADINAKITKVIFIVI